MYLCETIQELLRNNILPILNENDAVSVQESTFGENDLLASKVAVALIPFDLLIFLCDQNGLYTDNPDKNPQAKFISYVYSEADLYQCQFDKISFESKGGMQAKVKAALLAAKCGVKSVITNGENNAFKNIMEGVPIGTVFVPNLSISDYKAWLMIQEAKGSVIINDGAVQALIKKDGNSLLPIGIIGTEGDFHFDDIVNVKNSSKEIIAKGIVNYDSKEIAIIKGQHSSKIETILGYTNGTEVIHRDKMVCVN